MPTLVSTPGAQDANSYASLEEFDAWLDARLSAPDATDEGDRRRALIMATWRIDAEDFVGRPARPLNGTAAPPTQALKWPRWGAPAPGGWTYLTDVVPEPVKMATMELAVRILRDGPRDFLADADADLQGVERFESLKVDAITLKPRLRRAGGDLPGVVTDILGALLVGSRGRFALERG